MSKNETQPKFSKEQFLSSKQFTVAQKDILSVLLKDGETYTVDQAKKQVDDFLKKEVK